MSDLFVFRDPNALADADRISARRERVRAVSLEAVGEDPALAAAIFVADILDDDLCDTYTDVQACRNKLSETPGIWAKDGARDQLAFYDAALALLRNKPARM